MSDPKRNEKSQIIEQALLQSIGGGAFDVCAVPRPGDCEFDVCKITCNEDNHEEN